MILRIVKAPDPIELERGYCYAENGVILYWTIALPAHLSSFDCKRSLAESREIRNTNVRHKLSLVKDFGGCLPPASWLTNFLVVMLYNLHYATY